MYLSDFVGQKRVVKLLLAVMAAPTWCILLRGHYGYGKTTLAKIASAFYAPYDYYLCSRGTNPPMVNRYISIYDECHLLGDFIRFYPAMDNTRIIFCTNMDSQLPEPFISRCNVFRMEDYTLEEIQTIVRKSGIPQELCYVIAKRSKDNPRIAKMLVENYLAVVHWDKGKLTRDSLEEFFTLIGVDSLGLDEVDRAYIRALENAPNRVLSRRTLDALFPGVDLDRLEAYLIHKQIIQIGTGGRRLVNWR